MESTRGLIKETETRKLLGGIGRSKFYELCHQPDFPSLKIGRCVYVDRNRLDDWIAKQISNKANSETN